VLGAAAYFELYAGLVNAQRGEKIDLGPEYHAYTVREPYGVVGVITPWNAALNQAARAIAPALAVGNSVVVKPSEYTSTTTVALAQLATGAGLPDGVLNVVAGSGQEAGAALVEHQAVDKISFTGSVGTGRAIARLAGDRVIPCGLELGGKSANIVFADANLDAAVTGSVQAFTRNAGQICIAGTRLLVEESIADEFTEKLVAAVAEVRPGFDMGPIITERQFRKVQDYFEVAAAEGAVARIGGGRATELQGQFVHPTVYTQVTPDMRISREEVFGPVVCVLPFSDEANAVTMANDSDYGLVAGLWTRDLRRAHRVAAQLQAGQILVNEYMAEHVEVPFGGYKFSGIGREKGLEALREYSQEKSVVVRL
jgi:aldehyde dehydrogenase (NAD+)